jgi:hypothetical protein
MPLPPELKGKELVGSRWIRRMGKHRGILGTIVSFNDAGCKLEIRGRNQNQSHMGDKRFGSIQWPMLMNLYEPEGVLEDVIVTVDKNDFVVSAVKEADLSPGWIADNDTGDTYGDIEGFESTEVPMPTVETRICKGPWHRGKGGQGTQVPVTEFSVVKLGPRSGQIAKTCDTCLQKNHQYDQKRGKTNHAAVAPITTPANAIPVALNGTFEKLEVRPPAKHKWSVTIIKQVTVLVEADDFLDAGSLAGDGEIVRVERL